jgi:hypothetical protein
MDVRTCNRCIRSATTSITGWDYSVTLCATHAAEIVSFVDDLIADGMESFSSESADRCPNCLIPFTEERAIRIAIGAWRRHALCLMCAEPILSIVTSTEFPPESRDDSQFTNLCSDHS